MNRDMMVHGWPDLARLVQEREAAWRQARLRRASAEADETLVSRTDKPRPMRIFAVAEAAGSDRNPGSAARRP